MLRLAPGQPPRPRRQLNFLEGFLSSPLMAGPIQRFQNFSLSPALLSALQRVNYPQPTPIQAAVIPAALSGRDILGQAQTGTGKTAAFLLPFLNTWRDTNEPGPTALVLAP